MRISGTIVKINDDRGFGFIRDGDETPDQAENRFFHAKDCITPFEDLMEGDRVGYVAILSEKGPRAIKVDIWRGTRAPRGNRREFADDVA